MDVFKYLKNIYFGKKNIVTHIGIFSLLGIMCICTHSVMSSKFGNVFSEYLGYAPCGNLVLFLETCAGVFLLISMLGYIFQYANLLYSGEENLPEISLEAFSTFFKMLPLFIAWGIYMIILFLLGMSLLKFGTLSSFLYYAIVFSLPIFINIIYVMYAKDFEFDVNYFNPLFIFRIISNSLVSVIMLSFKLLILFILPAFLVYVVFKLSYRTDYEMINLFLRWLALCLAVYFSNVLHYVYVSGLVKIVKDNFIRG